MPSLCLVSVMPATALMVLADSVRLSSSRKPGMAEMREMHLQILGYRQSLAKASRFVLSVARLLFETPPSASRRNSRDGHRVPVFRKAEWA
jgi:hypothetical protein